MSDRRTETAKQVRKDDRRSLSWFTDCLRWALGLESYDEIKGKPEVKARRAKRRQRKGGVNRCTPISRRKEAA